VKMPKPSDADRDRFTALVPAGWSGPEAAPWVDRAFESAAALPPKQPKKRPAKRTTS